MISLKRTAFLVGRLFIGIINFLSLTIAVACQRSRAIPFLLFVLHHWKPASLIFYFLFFFYLDCFCHHPWSLLSYCSFSQILSCEAPPLTHTIFRSPINQQHPQKKEKRIPINHTPATWTSFFPLLHLHWTCGPAPSLVPISLFFFFCFLLTSFGLTLVYYF